jgi:hypothetical protein
MISDMDGMPQPYGCVQQVLDVSVSVAESSLFTRRGQMAKSARKRRARRKKSANHGKRPNA